MSEDSFSALHVGVDLSDDQTREILTTTMNEDLNPFMYMDHTISEV
jgi:hypothetical protein